MMNVHVRDTLRLGVHVGDQVVKAGNTTSFEWEFTNIDIVIVTMLLYNCTPSNIIDFLSSLSINDHVVFGWVQLFFEVFHFVNKAFKFFMLENASQVWVLNDSLSVTHQLNFRSIHRKIIHLTINLSFHFICFFVFNLTMLQHLLNSLVLVYQKIILGSTELDGLANFWEHLFDIGDHVLFCLHHLLVTL